MIFCISKNVHIVLESLSVTKLLKLTYCCFSPAKYPSKILFFENLGFWAPLVKRFRTLSSTAPMRSHWTFWRRPLSGATLLQLPPILLVRELELLLTFYQGHMEIDDDNGCCKSQFVAIFLNIWWINFSFIFFKRRNIFPWKEMSMYLLCMY